MLANDGMIISDTEPTDIGKYIWLRINPDGSRDWFAKLDGAWSLQKSELAPSLPGHNHDGEYAAPDHSHLNHGDINFTGGISVNGDGGVTGSKTVAGHTITFKNGILTGFT